MTNHENEYVCDKCKYADKFGDEEPCIDCDLHTNDKFEPMIEEKFKEILDSIDAGKR